MKHKEEGGYWPGFVDALTNVVFVMIIVVVVLMLMFMSTLMRVVHVERERAIAERAATEAMHEKETQQRQAESTVPEKSSRQTTIVAAPSPNVALVQVTPTQRLKALSGDVAADAAMVFVAFPARESSVDERALAALKSQLGPRMEELRANGISLRSDAVPPFVSEGRRLAYYRIVGIREWLLANGVTADKIDLRISDTPSVEGKQGVLVLSRPPAAAPTPAQ